MAGSKAVAVALVALLAVAAASGAAGLTVCRVDMDRMQGACRSYCTPGSREAAPRRECCDAVRGADFPCLCQYKNLLRSIGNIDAGRAMQIPSKCNIRAPRCAN